MNTFKRPLAAAIGLFSLSLLGTLAGCGGDDPASSGPKRNAGVDSGAPDANGSADGGAPDSNTQPDAAPCVPQAGEDRPDDDFADTNCDGIDGDVTQAVFVAPSGSDSAAGSMSAPVATLSKAVELAQAAQKDVYVCNGTYAENVVVDTTGVALYGGYDCTKSWSRGSERAVVAPGSGIPLLIKSADNTTIDRIELSASEGVDPGESSVAASVEASTGVVFNRAELIAKDGAAGQSGDVVPSAATAPAPSGLNGTSLSVTSVCPRNNPPVGPCTTVAAGGMTYVSTKCPGDPLEYIGGSGGLGGNVHLNKAPTKGGSGTPKGAPGGQLGGAGSPGKPGAAGEPGEPGGKIGSIVDGVYVASNAGTNATAGKTGEPGGGGSGGVGGCVPDVCGSYIVGTGGGQGGYPGCGGAGGKAGGGGGASIALITTDSSVTITWSKLRTGTGGAGGAPSDGVQGQVRGKGGNAGLCFGSGCAQGKPGGDGGNGGKGGPGGPGGGGPAIGILTLGTAPSMTNVTFDVGAPGKGASGFNGKDGADGETGSTVSLSTAP